MTTTKEANIRSALEAEGWSDEEVEAALEEHRQELSGDPDVPAKMAGIPARYRRVTWEGVEEDEVRKEAIVAARHWAEGTATARGLYLWSAADGEVEGDAYGVGKTRIAAAAALEILGRGRPLRWLDCARLMNDLNLSFKNPQYERAAAKLRAPSPLEVVVLDDIDKMPVTDRNVAPIFTLVNDCVNEETPLIITANRNLDSLAADFGSRFGEAIASRLVGHSLDIEVGGRDRRIDP